ncbi:hypothetical protein FI667_g15087, partial [Globisporangium splendens]
MAAAMAPRDQRMAIAAICDPMETSEATVYAAMPPVHPHRPSRCPSPFALLSSAAVTLSAEPSSSLLKKETTPARKKRSRRMSNSERGKLYRSRRKNYVESLESEVQDLKQEVQSLQVYGGFLQDLVLHAPHTNGGSFSRVVVEYFTLFETGIPLPSHYRHNHRHSSLNSKSSMDQNGGVALRPSARQAVFINTLMETNMAFCGNGGTKRLLQNWEFFSVNHASLHYRLTELQVVLSDEPTTAVVSANAVLHVCLTRATVEQMFPHVLRNEALVQKLVGLEMEYTVGNRFYFSRDSGKIYKYESEVDFLSAFMAVLGSLHDAMFIAGPVTKKQQLDQLETIENSTLSGGGSASGSSTESDNDRHSNDVQADSDTE